MSVLLRYLAKEIFLASLLVLVALLALFALFDVIRELGEMGKGNYSLMLILVYVLLSLPGHIYVVFPVAALIGTLFALSRMAQQSEVSVMRAAGLSLTKLAGYIALIGAGFSLVVFAFGELIVPQAEELSKRLRLQATGSVVAQEFRSGFWVKDDKSFVNIQTVTADTRLEGVRVYEFDAAYRLLSISVAREARFNRQGRWELIQVERTRFEGGSTKVEKLAASQWNSVLTPDLLAALKVKPEEMSMGNLSAYIEHLRENRQKSTRYELALWFKVVRPLAVIVMMLLALPFALQSLRAGGISAKLVAGIMIGLGFHFLSQLFSNLALLNDWAPAFASLAPTGAFLVLACVMLALKERPSVSAWS